jgi:hypothetical protein
VNAKRYLSRPEGAVIFLIEWRLRHVSMQIISFVLILFWKHNEMGKSHYVRVVARDVASHNTTTLSSTVSCIVCRNLFWMVTIS